MHKYNIIMCMILDLLGKIVYSKCYDYISSSLGRVWTPTTVLCIVRTPQLGDVEESHSLKST